MKKYKNFYQNYSGFAPIVFALNSVFSRSKIRRLSLINRQKDYIRLNNNTRLFNLHREINECLFKSQETWESYDYGEGYFYQSLDLIGVTGLRDTHGRVEAMGLKDLLKDKSVLDIGCNAGFLSLSIADVTKQVTGFDMNPDLIDIGKTAARYLGCQNIQLSVSSVEEFDLPEPVDAVLSLANHSTFDGNISISVRKYFERCYRMIKPGGLLLFESHPPEYEGKAIEQVCSTIGEMFEILDRRFLNYGSFLDRGRTFIIARPR